MLNRRRATLGMDNRIRRHGTAGAAANPPQRAGAPMLGAMRKRQAAGSRCVAAPRCLAIAIRTPQTHAECGPAQNTDTKRTQLRP